MAATISGARVVRLTIRFRGHVSLSAIVVIPWAGKIMLMGSSWLATIGYPDRLLGLTVDKTITDTGLGLDVARFIGIIPELLADLADKVA
jgi:hypothetical protein